MIHVSVLKLYTKPYRIEYDCPHCGAHVSRNWNTFAMEHNLSLYNREQWPSTINCHNCGEYIDIDIDYDYRMP